MKKLICVLMAALMAIGSAAAAEQTEDDLLESMISAMALRDKVAQMMLPSFRLWKEVPEKEEEREKAKEDPGVKITELNDEIRGMLAEVIRIACTCGYVPASGCDTADFPVIERDRAVRIVFVIRKDAPAALGHAAKFRSQGIRCHTGIIILNSEIRADPVQFHLGPAGAFSAGDAVSDKLDREMGLGGREDLPVVAEAVDGHEIVRIVRHDLDFLEYADTVPDPEAQAAEQAYR